MADQHSTSLKEIKVPVYRKCKKYDDYIIRLMHEAGARGRIRKVLMGGFMALMHRYTVNEAGERVTGELSDTQRAMAK